MLRLKLNSMFMYLILVAVSWTVLITGCAISAARTPTPTPTRSPTPTFTPRPSPTEPVTPAVTHSGADHSVPSTSQISFTLKTGLSQGKLVFIGQGGSIEGQINPRLQVKEGQKVNFTLVNGDGIEHDLNVAGYEALAGRVSQAGQSSSLAYTADKSGQFAYFCSLPGHRQAGMEGLLEVAGSQASDRPVVTEPIPAGGELADGVRTYNLEIVESRIDYGNGAVWNTWTYNATVPGPVIRAKVGETLRVRVVNHHSYVHSFHTHLTNYPFAMDGSQANVIGGQGAGGMIPPGGEYTYEFKLTEPGIYYYHCHSADGGFHIAQHIQQGLYGAIIVEDPEAPAMREEVLFMGESGHDKTGDVPQYIMNGLGLPGGEHTLEQIFLEKGIEGVVAQLGKTVPFFNAKVNEPIKLHVINIGDQVHSLHIHHTSHISLAALGGRSWPANVVPLVQGTADTLKITFTEPGLWLFHCHVVPHADAGMIGLFIAE